MSGSALLFEGFAAKGRCRHDSGMHKFFIALAVILLLAFAVHKDAPIALEAPWIGTLKIGKQS